MKKLLIVLMVAIVISLLTACNIPFFGKEEPKPVTKTLTPAQKEAEKKGLDPGKLNEASKLIEDFFNNAYSKSIDSYNSAVAYGKIPEGYMDYLATRIIKEGNENPEVGLAYPRYVGLNGVNIVEYVPMYQSQYVYNMDYTLVGKKNNGFWFYVTFYVKARVLPDDAFNRSYKYNPITHVYENILPEDTSRDDMIKTKVKYEVIIGEDGKKMKIFQVRESDFKPNIKFTNIKENNDFMTREEYLFTGNVASIKKEELKATLQKEVEALSKEQLLIKDFIKKITVLDRERMNLMFSVWNKNKKSFADFLIQRNLIGRKNVESEINGYLNYDNIVIGEDYRNTFDYEAFPVRNNMIQIKKLNEDKIKITQHPLYTPKNKRLIAEFSMLTELDGGIPDRSATYNYKYEFGITKPDNTPFIKSMKLIEYYSPDNKGIPVASKKVKAPAKPKDEEKEPK